MADFTDEEIKKAAQRVMEMRNRSVFSGETEKNRNNAPPAAPPFVKMAANSSAPREQSQNNPTVPSGVGKLLNMINFKGVGIDGDTNLLIGILLLLGGESTDELLTLALIYIML